MIGDHGDPVQRHAALAPRLVLDQKMDPIMVECNALDLQPHQNIAIQMNALVRTCLKTHIISHQL